MSPSAITIGPESRLHRGYHRALLDDPPPSVTYLVSDPTALFASYVSTAEFSPCDHFAVLERHLYAGQPDFIHSVQFPVANRDVPWLLETDSLLAHLQYGHAIFNPRFTSWLQDARTHALVAERLANMLQLVASPHCVAMVFHSHAQAEANKKQCLAVLPSGCATFVEELFAKAIVCYPAQPARMTEQRLRARNANRRRGVVFAASGFEAKGGRVTLDLYRRLLDRTDVELCYFGPVPEDLQSDYADVLARIEYAVQLPRELLLEVFAEAHILVFPSRHEALGITLLEALSCGLAVVTTKGPGMENVVEAVDEGVGGILVEKPSIHEDPPVEALHDAVVTLLDDRARYEAMSLHNLRQVQQGRFAISRRNATLLEVYGTAFVSGVQSHRPLQRWSTPVDDHKHRLEYACPFSSVAEAVRQRFARSSPAESSILVPALSVADVVRSTEPMAEIVPGVSDISSWRVASSS